MKALIINEFKTPFELTELAIPEITSQQVLVQIVSSGVNPIDIKIKAGIAPHAQTKLPQTVLGIEMSGIVVAVGEDTKKFTVGDQVFGLVGGVAGMQGTLAEYAAADPALLAIKPAHLGFKEAASLPLNAVTAWEALVERANVRKNDKVLIHGGAGGVGHLAIQIAVTRGAEVFATGTSRQLDVIRGLGAWPIDYENQQPDDYVNVLTDGQGFDVILDTVGGAVLDASFQSVKRYTGRVISILGWGEHSLASLSFRGASYSGVFALYPLISGVERQRQRQGTILDDVAMLISAGKLRSIVSEVEFSLGSVEDAYQRIERRTIEGKVVISVAETVPTTT